MDKVTNKYCVYILFSLADNGFYIGFTEDLKQGLIFHAKGKVLSTKFRRPLRLIHYEYFINKNDALSREEYLKSGYGRRNLKEMIKRTLDFYLGSKNSA